MIQIDLPHSEKYHRVTLIRPAKSATDRLLGKERISQVTNYIHRSISPYIELKQKKYALPFQLC